jgi:hypothetical protein
VDRGGLLAHVELGADLAVRAALGHEEEDLVLARGEAQAVGGGGLGLDLGRGLVEVDPGAAGQRGDVVRERPGAHRRGARVGRAQRLGRLGVAAGRDVRLGLAEAGVGGRPREAELLEGGGHRRPGAGI